MIINDIEELKSIAKKLRLDDSLIGLCHGCFDLVHLGHVHHFKQAKAMVDCLFVSITADSFVNKGADRPIFTSQKRAEFVSSIRYCDYVIINKFSTAEHVIEMLRPNIYFKGADYGDGLDERLLVEQAITERSGGRMVLTDDMVFDSTSRIAQLVLSKNIGVN